MNRRTILSFILAYVLLCLSACVPSGQKTSDVGVKNSVPPLTATSCPSVGDEPNGSEASGKTDSSFVNSEALLSVFEFNDAVFDRFIASPNIETLKNEGASTYSLTDSSLEQTLFIGTTRIEKELFESLVCSETLKELFESTGLKIDGNISKIALISSKPIPLTAWALANGSSYFLTATPRAEGGYDFASYRFEDFAAKFTAKNATLVVNGQEMDLNEMAKIYDNHADIPLIPVLEGLGAEIQWTNSEKTTAEIKYKNISLTLNIEESSLVLNGTGLNLLAVLPDATCYVSEQTGGLIIDDALLGRISAILGAKIFLDRANLIITVQ